MSTLRSLPTFEPIPRQLIDPPRYFSSNLEVIQLPDFDPRIPFGWGFTIYRTVFGHGTDARFAEGLSRLEKWMKWETRDARYHIGGYETVRPEDIPAPGEPHITDEIAARMYNEVVEEYPDAQDIITEPEGSEDFSPVARDFMSRVESFNIDFDECDWVEGRRHSRYDTCLIIDERVLKMLEGLPEDPPEVIPRGDSDPEREATIKLLEENWIWILNRETAMQIEEGVEGEVVQYPPWLRIRLESLRNLFFKRAFGYISPYWPSRVEEDKERWDTVRWWSEIGYIATEVRQLARAGLLFGKMEKDEEETLRIGDEAAL
ncbi:hypothetical protein GGI35DRAFT_492045 [Trichoderma velutinum]